MIRALQITGSCVQIGGEVVSTSENKVFEQGVRLQTFTPLYLTSIGAETRSTAREEHVLFGTSCTEDSVPYNLGDYRKCRMSRWVRKRSRDWTWRTEDITWWLRSFNWLRRGSAVRYQKYFSNRISRQFVSILTNYRERFRWLSRIAYLRCVVFSYIHWSFSVHVEVLICVPYELMTRSICDPRRGKSTGGSQIAHASPAQRPPPSSALTGRRITVESA